MPSASRQVRKTAIINPEGTSSLLAKITATRRHVLNVLDRTLMCAELQCVKYLLILSGEILYCRGCYFKCCFSVALFYRLGNGRVYFTVNVIYVCSLFLKA